MSQKFSLSVEELAAMVNTPGPYDIPDNWIAGVGTCPAADSMPKILDLALSVLDFDSISQLAVRWPPDVWSFVAGVGSAAACEI